MLEEIYYKRKIGIPIITILLILTCTIVSVPTYFNNEIYEVFASHGKVLYWWQYFTGNFEHSITTKYFFWAHYLGNMFVIGLNGWLIERIIGSRRMLLVNLVALVISCIQFRIFFPDPTSTGAGTSGIAWSYLPISFYVFIQCIKEERRKITRCPFFYVLIFGFIFAWGFVTVMSSWEETNKSHLVATAFGVVMLIVMRQCIDKNLRHIAEGQLDKNGVVHKKDALTIIAASIVPVGMMVILSAYLLGGLDPFINPSYISEYESYQKLKQSDGIIELHFEEALSDDYSLRIDLEMENENEYEDEERVEGEIEYSGDRKTMYLILKNYELLKYAKGSIILDGMRLESGRKVKPIKFVIR